VNSDSYRTEGLGTSAGFTPIYLTLNHFTSLGEIKVELEALASCFFFSSMDEKDNNYT
jgi:hypothetical protein